jgi:hypothetical protein
MIYIKVYKSIVSYTMVLPTNDLKGFELTEEKIQEKQAVIDSDSK